MNQSKSTSTDGVIDWDAYVPQEETRAVAEAARDHFSSLFSTDDVRRVLDGEARPDLWEPLTDHGYTLVGVPEALDGLGGFIDLVALLEEAGRALLPAPLLTHTMAVQTLQRVGLLDGDLVARRLAFARVDGRRLLIFDGPDADVAVSVDASTTGCTVHLHTLGDAPRDVLAAVDPTRPHVSVTLDRVESTAHHVDAHADAVLAAARTCISADLVGVAACALDGGVEHALDREQFGRPIASFQAIKHQLADAYVLVERARSLVLGSAIALGGAPEAETARLSRLAKAAAADAAARCTALQTQLLGAMGLTFESDGPLAVRRARHTIPLLGNSAELYAAVAADVMGGR